MEKQIIGYRVIADCTLESTNFEIGEDIIIAEQCENYDWKGTIFFDTHPQEFAPIYENDHLAKALLDLIQAATNTTKDIVAFEGAEELDAAIDFANDTLKSLGYQIHNEK